MLHLKHLQFVCRSRWGYELAFFDVLLGDDLVGGGSVQTGFGGIIGNTRLSLRVFFLVSVRARRAF